MKEYGILLTHIKLHRVSPVQKLVTQTSPDDRWLDQNKQRMSNIE